MRNRRVGTLTMGLVMIGIGILSLMHLAFPELLDYIYIFKMWPLVLIFLGIETLVSYVARKEQILRYDGWSIVIIMGMGAFAAGMAVLQHAMEYAEQTYHGQLFFWTM